MSMKYVIIQLEFKIPPEYTYRMLHTNTTDIIQMAKNFRHVGY
jgi:hypothetical protein